jgi:hypothetical protein
MRAIADEGQPGRPDRPYTSPPVRVRFPPRDPGDRGDVSASASLLLFGDEQISLPGIHGCAVESRAEPEAESPPAGPRVSQCPGQLCFGHSQMLLDDADPDPRQPSLLPEPPPWDLVERPNAPEAPRPDRAPRIGQEALFPNHG